jgi:hypothetical protein
MPAGAPRHGNGDSAHEKLCPSSAPPYVFNNNIEPTACQSPGRHVVSGVVPAASHDRSARSRSSTPNPDHSIRGITWRSLHLLRPPHSSLLCPFSRALSRPLHSSPIHICNSEWGATYRQFLPSHPKSASASFTLRIRCLHARQLQCWLDRAGCICRIARLRNPLTADGMLLGGLAVARR